MNNIIVKKKESFSLYGENAPFTINNLIVYPLTKENDNRDIMETEFVISWKDSIDFYFIDLFTTKSQIYTDEELNNIIQSENYTRPTLE